MRQVCDIRSGSKSSELSDERVDQRLEIRVRGRRAAELYPYVLVGRAQYDDLQGFLRVVDRRRAVRIRVRSVAAPGQHLAVVLAAQRLDQLARRRAVLGP